MKTGKKKSLENLDEWDARSKKIEEFYSHCNKIRENERRFPISFDDFLFLCSMKPEFVFRDIFQLFYDMVHYYVPEGVDDYEITQDSVGFVHYDSSNLFVKDCDNPFFADRLFMNRLMNLVDSFKKGSQFNYIYLFEGPPGSGKSTFLNNLLNKFEDYTKTETGTIFKIYWRLDIGKLGGFRRFDRKYSQAMGESIGKESNPEESQQNNGNSVLPSEYLEFSCPNHDHPIFLIPKQCRREFLDNIIYDKKFKEKLLYSKEYEWVLKGSPCNICSSIFTSLQDIVTDASDIYKMIHVRKNFFGRQFGEGISVFNPGDPLIKEPVSNPQLQNLINNLLRNDDVRFKYSYLAKTNVGILALMDIMEHNVERLKEYHGVISDGVHKVGLSEEYIRTLFMGLVNPEDTVHYEKIKSFQDRIITVNVPYVLDYNIEVAIYKEHFGDEIIKRFLPMVLKHFARIIISTRLEKESTGIKKWLTNPEKYSKYTDKNFLLLKMSIYTGKIPDWITEEDIKRFDKNIRKSILAESDNEGLRGFSGRQSLTVFNSFLSYFEDSDDLITIENVKEFFLMHPELADKGIPEGFIDSLIDMYDYNVLQEVKEAIYYFNESQISRDIQNYLFAINYEPGETKKCEYTGDMLELSEDYYKNFEALFLGTTSTHLQRLSFRKDAHAEYITKTLAQEIRIQGRKINETEQFKSLFEKYTRNLKENALAPYQDNDTFRRALHDWGKAGFKAYDEKMKRDVTRLIASMKKKFGYSEKGAQQVCLYILEKNLSKKY